MFDHANCFFVDTIERPTESEPVPPSKKITVPEYGAFSKVHVPIMGSVTRCVVCVEVWAVAGEIVFPELAGDMNVVSGDCVAVIAARVFSFD